VAGDGNPFVIHLSSPPKFWDGLLDVVDMPELKEDSRFISREVRKENYDVLRDILNKKFKTNSRQHWLDLLEKHGVPSAPIQTIEEVFNDPQVRHLKLEVEVQHPEMGPTKLAGSGIWMSKTPPQIKLPPPALGEHTEEILKNIGYSDDDCKLFHEKGVI
jgi:crotonobetainyl-CoA:carnitine CoA-transferase CaiB-like acyl-CoA transferase